MEPFTVFVSYSRADSEFVLKLARDLRSAGVRIWLDQLDITPSQRWDKEIEKALGECASILVVLSPTSVGSENVLDEVAAALDSGKSVVPVICQKCKIPYRLHRVQYVDFTSGYEDNLKRLITVFQQGGGPSRGEKPGTVSPPAKTLQAILQRRWAKQFLWIALAVIGSAATLVVSLRGCGSIGRRSEVAEIICHVVAGDSAVPRGLQGNVYFEVDTSGVKRQELRPVRLDTTLTFDHLPLFAQYSFRFVATPERDTVKYPVQWYRGSTTAGHDSVQLSVAARLQEVRFLFGPENAELNITSQDKKLAILVRAGEHVRLLPGTYAYRLQGERSFEPREGTFPINAVPGVDTVTLPALHRRRVSVRLWVIWEGYENRVLLTPQIVIRKGGTPVGTIPSGQKGTFEVHTTYELGATARYILQRPVSLAGRRTVEYRLPVIPTEDTVFVRVPQ